MSLVYGSTDICIMQTSCQIILFTASMKLAQTSFLLLACLYSQALQTHGQSRSTFDLRLVTGGTSPPASFVSGGSSGRLEVYYESRWGTVCEDSFSSNEANVACRQLGYSFALNYRSVSRTANRLRDGSSVPIFLSNVDCDGSESRLSQCSYDVIGLNNCFHYMDVDLTCATTTDTTIGITVGVPVGVVALIVIVIVEVVCCILCCVCCRVRSRASRNAQAQSTESNVCDTRHVLNTAYESHELQADTPSSEIPSQPTTSTDYDTRHIQNTAYETHIAVNIHQS